MVKENIQFPEICPHCEKNNSTNKWCYETEGDNGTIYGYCNRQAEPAIGWVATKDTDKNGIPKYIYQESQPEKTYPRETRTTYNYFNSFDNKLFVREVREDFPNGEKKIYLQINNFLGKFSESFGTLGSKVSSFSLNAGTHSTENFSL